MNLHLQVKGNFKVHISCRHCCILKLLEHSEAEGELSRKTFNSEQIKGALWILGKEKALGVTVKSLYAASHKHVQLYQRPLWPWHCRLKAAASWHHHAMAVWPWLTLDQQHWRLVLLDLSSGTSHYLLLSLNQSYYLVTLPWCVRVPWQCSVVRSKKAAKMNLECTHTHMSFLIVPLNLFLAKKILQFLRQIAGANTYYIECVSGCVKLVVFTM